MVICQKNLHRKKETSILIRGRENRSCSLNLTDGQTKEWTDINSYRLALLLKTVAKKRKKYVQCHRTRQTLDREV